GLLVLASAPRQAEGHDRRPRCCPAGPPLPAARAEPLVGSRGGTHRAVHGRAGCLRGQRRGPVDPCQPAYLRGRPATCYRRLRDHLRGVPGHRRSFLAGLATFTLASLGCGLAASTAVLIALRFLQGAGAAAMIPQVLSLIQRTFDGPARGRPMRLYAAALAGGAVTGQVVGGVL